MFIGEFINPSRLVDQCPINKRRTDRRIHTAGTRRHISKYCLLQEGQGQCSASLSRHLVLCTVQFLRRLKVSNHDAERDSSVQNASATGHSCCGEDSLSFHSTPSCSDAKVSSSACHRIVIPPLKDLIASLRCGIVSQGCLTVYNAYAGFCGLLCLPSMCTALVPLFVGEHFAG